MRGRIVIGEGERDEAPMLYIAKRLAAAQSAEVDGEEFPEVDIAVDPWRAQTSAARRQQRHRCARGGRTRRTLKRAGHLHGQDVVGLRRGVVDMMRLSKTT